VTPYLSVCAVYRDEGPYLREWIEFHRLVGVERFFLYDNRSEDDHREVLEPYVDEGVVVLHDWPIFPAQMQAYEHCIKQHKHDARWIGFLDLDEFLFSPTGTPVSELLVPFERHPGVGVNWAVFGSSGHATKPPGLISESYLRRTVDPDVNAHIKSIVDPRRVRSFCVPHFFMYTDGPAVDENGRPIDRPPYSRTESVSFEKLRINHYQTKSEEEYRRKLARGPADSTLWFKEKLTEVGIQRRLRKLDQADDQDILRYVPALREALGETARQASR
jgi:hypothetical protein